MQTAWVRGRDAAAKRKERRTEEGGSGETGLLIAVVEGNSHARKEMGGGETSRRDGDAKIFSVSDHRYNHSQGKGFPQAHSVQGTYPLRSQSQTLCPCCFSICTRDFFSTAVEHLQERYFVFARRVEYLLLNFMQGNVESEVLGYLSRDHHHHLQD